MIVVAAPVVQVGHRLGVVAGTCSAPASAYSGNFSSCITVGTRAVPPATIWSIRSGVRPVPCSMQSMPASRRPRRTRVAEAVRGDLGAVLVGHPDRLGEGLGRERGGEVALVARDPVADQLDPAVAALRLLRDVRRELVGLDLVGVVADVALGPRDVPPRPDQPREVLALVDPRGVGGRPAVADQQRPAVAVVDRLLLGLLVADRAVVVEAEVAVGVDEAGDDPPLRRGLRAGLGLVGDGPSTT